MAAEFLEHATTCDRCGEILIEHSDFALRLMEATREPAADWSSSLRPLHTEVFHLGKMLATRLPGDVRERLRAIDVERLRHEVRCADGLPSAGPDEIGAAVAVSEVGLACEGLAFQDLDGIRAILITPERWFAGGEEVPPDYVPARVQDALHCSSRDADVITRALIRMILDPAGSPVSVPDFEARVHGDRLLLVHVQDERRIGLARIDQDGHRQDGHRHDSGPPSSPDQLDCLMVEFVGGARTSKLKAQSWAAAWDCRSTDYGMECRPKRCRPEARRSAAPPAALGE
jgi:hypothetical protein